MTEWQPIETAQRGSVFISITRGQTLIIDAVDVEFVSSRKWQAKSRSDGKGYYVSASDGKRLHRLLLNVPSNVIVDHINGNGLDNRRCNLRIGTQSLNCVNRKTTPGPYLRGTRPQKGKWRASIKLNGRQRSLGYFSSMEEAHAAYLAAANQAYGDWMPLPEPPK